MLSTGLTVVFGAVDLTVQTPFMLKYEAVVTSLALSATFAFGARGPKPMIEEIAERRVGTAWQPRPDITRFFRILTLVWAGYFTARAVAYLGIARRFSVSEAMALRAVIGPASLAAVFAVSLQGRRLLRLFSRLAPASYAAERPTAAQPSADQSFTRKPR